MTTMTTEQANTIYDNIKGSMVDNLPNLTKKFGEMVLAGEVYRCNTDRSKLSKDNNKYSLSLKIDKPTFVAFKKFVSENGKLTGLKAVEVKVKELDEEGNPVKRDDKFVFVEDDMGDVVKEFSHYQISVYQNPTIKGEDVEVSVTDVLTGEPVTGVLAEGSRVAVNVSAYDTVFRDNPARGLNLGQIKVFEHVALSGGGGSDPWAAFGLSKADIAASAPPPPSAPAQGPFKEAISPELPEDEEDDQIPF